MNYEQKYKEALRVMESLYNVVKYQSNSDALLTTQTIEKAFPEFKESEDERIRKSLIALIKEIKLQPLKRLEDWNGMLDWLEKQGEQKPQGKSSLEVWKDMRFEVYQQASGNRHEPNYSDDATKMFSLNDIDEIFEKIAEKQGEQKHAWSEDDEEKLNSMTEFERAIAVYIMPQLAKYTEEQISHIKSVSNNIMAQIPKTSWKPTEEQMMTLCALCVLHKESKVLESLYNDLKTL